MKNKTISVMKVHVGVTSLCGASTTIEAAKHQAEMELGPIGVLVRWNKKVVLVPYTNITHMELTEQEELKEEKPSKK